jgi:GGDEF domain-containing protein
MCADWSDKQLGFAAFKKHPLNTRHINHPGRAYLSLAAVFAAALCESVSVSAAETVARSENSGLQNGIRWDGHFFEFGSVQIPELIFLSAVGIGLIFLLLFLLSSRFTDSEVRRKLREPEPGAQRWTFFARGMQDAELSGKNKDGAPKGLSIRDYPEEPQMPNFRLNRHRNTASGFLNKTAWTELMEEYSEPAPGSAVGLIHAEGFKPTSAKEQDARRNLAMSALNGRLRSAVAGNVRIFHIEPDEFLLFFPQTTEQELFGTLKTAQGLFTELMQEYGLPRTVLLGQSRISGPSPKQPALPELLEDAFAALQKNRAAQPKQQSAANSGQRRAFAKIRELG